jgi:O-glycosyl hydrolase
MSMRSRVPLCVGLIVPALLLGPAGLADTATVTIDGSQTYQVIEGFGVNANYWSWSSAELQPVLDALIDDAGMTMFRIVFNQGWEATNDNSDSSLMNWAYYNALYDGPEFQKLWGLMAYLNQKGVTNGVMPNFQGYGPDWMCTWQNILAPDYEDEWAEMIASLLLYARNTRHLQFNLVAPHNEPDIASEGIGMADAEQYVTSLRKLAQQLDANGLDDMRFVVPDRSDSGINWLPETMSDPTVMSKLAHFGLHSYGNWGSGSAGVGDLIQQSAYPDRTFWMTEFNVWCDSCEAGLGNTNDWEYCRGTAEYLLGHLANGATAGMVWEGYDSYYPHHGCWSFWGLLGVDDTNAVPRTYTPRKNFYTLAQIAKFVRPGAQRIDVSGSSTPLTVLAFYNTNNGQFTLTGVNTASTPATLTGTLTSLPAIGSLDLYHTDTNSNLCHGATFPVTDGSFSATVPADCVFTLANTNPPPTPGPASGTTFYFGPPATPVWDVSGTYRITNHMQGAKLQPLDIVFKDVALAVDARGHLRGSGTIQVLVGEDTVAGDYKLSGTVTGGGAKTRVNFSIKFKGKGVVSDVLTTCTISAKYNLNVESIGLTLVGKTSGSVHFSNRGSGSLKSDISLPLPSGVDGGWHVTLDIYPVGTKLSGTAVVLVDNTSSSTLATKATGSLPKQSTAAKVKLAGYGYSAGTRINLQYTPILGATNLLSTVTGKVLGQNVKN